MEKEKIVLGNEMETPSWSLRKKLLGFDVGMTYYSSLEKDEENFTIIMAVSS